MGRRTEIDSDLPEQWSLSELTVRAFDILYSALDREQAVTSILELIGDTFGVSGPIFLKTWMGRRRAAIPLSGVRVERLLKRIRSRPYLTGREDKITGIISMRTVFSIAQISGNCPTGSARFSKGRASCRCCSTRSGTAARFMALWALTTARCGVYGQGEQIDALTFVGKLLCVFLLKSRAQEALTDTLSNLRSVLDHQEVFLYVLDRKRTRYGMSTKKPRSWCRRRSRPAVLRVVLSKRCPL